MAMEIRPDEITSLIRDRITGYEAGEADLSEVGSVLEIPVGEALLGRMVNPLGQPLDDKGEINTTETRPAEFKAPGVVQRQPVNVPMATGLKAIDSMIPIGRGQRELIIGDRPSARRRLRSTRSSIRRAPG